MPAPPARPSRAALDPENVPGGADGTRPSARCPSCGGYVVETWADYMRSPDDLVGESCGGTAHGWRLTEIAGSAASWTGSSTIGPGTWVPRGIRPLNCALTGPTAAIGRGSAEPRA